MRVLFLYFILGSFVTAVASQADQLFPETADIFIDESTPYSSELGLEPINFLDKTTELAFAPNNVDVSVMTELDSTSLFHGVMTDGSQLTESYSTYLSPDDILDGDQLTESHSVSSFLDHSVDGDGSDLSSWFLDNTMNWDSATGSDLAFVSEDTEWLPVNESEPPLLVADDDVDCAVGDVDDTQLFGKKRRRAICPAPPVGQAGEKTKPDNPEDDPFDFESFMESRPSPAQFPRRFDLCPEILYKKSTIPVCFNPMIGELVTHKPDPWVNLRNVLNTYELIGCGPGSDMWCCERVFRRGARNPPVKVDIDQLAQLDVEFMRLVKHMAENVYDADVCYPQPAFSNSDLLRYFRNPGSRR